MAESTTELVIGGLSTLVLAYCLTNGQLPVAKQVVGPAHTVVSEAKNKVEGKLAKWWFGNQTFPIDREFSENFSVKGTAGIPVPTEARGTLKGKADLDIERRVLSYSGRVNGLTKLPLNPSAPFSFDFSGVAPVDYSGKNPTLNIKRDVLVEIPFNVLGSPQTALFKGIVTARAEADLTARVVSYTATVIGIVTAPGQAPQVVRYPFAGTESMDKVSTSTAPPSGSSSVPPTGVPYIPGPIPATKTARPSYEKWTPTRITGSGSEYAIVDGPSLATAQRFENVQGAQNFIEGVNRVLSVYHSQGKPFKPTLDRIQSIANLIDTDKVRFPDMITTAEVDDFLEQVDEVERDPTQLDTYNFLR